MDSNISLQIKRLIEVDRRAVELAEKRESEFQDLEEKHKGDSERINGLLQAAREEAKRSYNEQIRKAQEEVALMSDKLEKRILEIEKTMSQATEKLAQELWQELLENLKQ